MIVGISGKMGTGKTVLANHLAELCGGRVVSFADALRSEVADVFSLPLAAMTSRECKEHMLVPVGFNPMSVRQLLQWWGALRRESDQDYWVRQLIESVAGDELVLVDDVRYRNEARVIREEGGMMIRLDPYDGWQRGIGADHLSETDLDDGVAFDWRSAPAFGQLQPLAVQLAGLIG
ncbi:MAG: hypothetical protein FDZ69_07525 [Deltaproteobacteria bacterium]|nr:MAG: hypothetical protein FDZ69_07525 [Deltaproteobacteria bacterium]